jgi:spore maturation protein SpmA
LLNWVFLLLVGGAVVTASFTGTMKDIGDASLNSARTAVELSFGLVGQMAMWLGFMRVLQQAGLMRSIGNALRPIMRRLFPDVPSDHPAMGAMIMNLAANMAGLGNAATPFGLKAMQELNKLNPHPGVATNAMALFLAINTAGVAVLPLTVIATRATLGSHNAAGVILPSILATAVTTIMGVIVAKLLQRRPRYAPERFVSEAVAQATSQSGAVSGLEQAEESASRGLPIPRGRIAFMLVVGALLCIGLGLQAKGWRLSGFEWGSAGSVPIPRALLTHVDGAATPLDIVRSASSDWLLPVLMLAIVLYGFGRQVKVYEAFISGAKEGFQIAITIIPFLVAILVAVGMFRASGAMGALIALAKPIATPLGIPVEVLPMGLLKPLSGTGAFAIMTDTMKTYGVDSLYGYMVSVMNGSTETTFYVLAVYFGSVQVRAVRHTLLACLTADAIGLASAVYLSRLFYSPG